MMRWIARHDYDALVIVVYPIVYFVGFTKGEGTYFSWDALLTTIVSWVIFSSVITAFAIWRDKRRGGDNSYQQ